MPFNLGLNFVSLFRWILLLLFALLIEKSAEGITYLVNSQVIFTEHVVHSPLFGDHDLTKLTPMPNWPYVVGILQMVITLLFATRYFLCLVDPLERIIGIHSEQVEVADSEKMEKALGKIRIGHVILVVLIAIPEFLFLFHASTSFSSYHQWVCFLLLLVIWDSLLFIGIIGNLHHLVSMFIRIQRRYLRMTQWISRRIYAVKIYKRFIKDLDTGELLNKFEKERTEKNAEYDGRLERYENIKHQLKNIRVDYGPWNLLDLIVLLTGLLDKQLYQNPVVTSLIDTNNRLNLIVIIFIVLIVLLVAWNLTRRYLSKNEERAKLKMGFVAAGLVLLIGSILVYFDSLTSLSRSIGASEFILLSIICAGTFVFSYLNYKAQPELWQRHLMMLRLR